MTTELRKHLYTIIKQRRLGKSQEWEFRSIGEDMTLLSHSIFGWWKPIYLIDEKNKSAVQFMDAGETLLNVRDEDIDWESVRGLAGENRARSRSAQFPTIIRGFKDGVSEVEWQVNPDGRYYEDEDGYGMTSDEEEALFGYIDRNGDVVAPFTYIGKDYEILDELRRQAVEKVRARTSGKRLYFDMDGVIVDFESGLAQQSEQTLREYEGRYDEIPGLFGAMKPMPGAIDAVRRLNEHYDCYILSTAPWKNPSAWSDKVIWITKYLDDVFHKKVIITHCKNLCKGDILIDDRGKNGTSEFEGEWIQFGSEQFPDWNAVLDYLLPD